MKRVLVVAAHPDDEVLGCGGTIARHLAEGDEVHVIFMADGVGSREENFARELAIRNAAKERAMHILGVTSFSSLKLADNRMDGIELLDIVKKLETALSTIQPTTIYTHHYGDLNIDHQITHQAVLTACRPIPSSSVSEILTFEVISSTEWSGHASLAFIPNVYVDIIDYWQLKLDALNAYSHELRPEPHSRSIKHLDALSKHRGACMGMNRAEAFMMVRCLK